MKYVQQAIRQLQIVRDSTDVIGVGCSFGKDSLAVLDLCCRVFPRVEAFYLYRVRGLSFVDDWIKKVQARYGVVFRQYPSGNLSHCYANSVLQPHWSAARKAPIIKQVDIENTFRCDAGVEWIALGWRRSDSFNRAIILKKSGGIDFGSRRIFPIRTWKRSDVYAYLARRKITPTPGFGRKEQGGLDFHPGAIDYIRQRPADWDRLTKDFPFIGVQSSEIQLQKSTACLSQEKA